MHRRDLKLNYERQLNIDWTKYPQYATPDLRKFYKISDLDNNGFIHDDCSLKIRLFVKKNNYKKRLEKTQEELEITKGELDKAKDEN